MKFATVDIKFVGKFMHLFQISKHLSPVKHVIHNTSRHMNTSSVLDDGYVAECTTMVWYYPNHPSYQKSLRAAIISNTVLTLLAIILNYKNCKVLLKHRREKHQAANIIILSGRNSSLYVFFFFLMRIM